MADSSFDIVSKVDKQEAENALNQAAKEIEQRYDFKGVGASIEWSGEKVLMKASTDDRVKAVLEVFEQKLVKRGISIKSLDAGAVVDPRLGGGKVNSVTKENLVRLVEVALDRAFLAEPLPGDGAWRVVHDGPCPERPAPQPLRPAHGRHPARGRARPRGG